MNQYKTRITRTLCIFVSIFIFSISTYGQSDQKSKSISEAKNSLFIEGLGHGFVYSINYERLLFDNEKTHTSAHIGIGYYGKKSGVIPLWVPISLIESIKLNENQFIEVGVGKMFTNDGIQFSDGTFENNYEFEDWIFRLGYKHYFKNKKWLLKIAYTPIILDKTDFIHWGGASFGYRF